MDGLVEIRGGGCIPRMSQQPELTSTPLAPSPAPAPGSTYISASNAAPTPVPELSSAQQQDQRHTPQRIPPWLESTELFLRTFVLMFVGMAICIAPWSGDLLWFLPRSRFLWDQNPLILYFPVLAHYAANGAVRGVVSGLGLLNLWVAFHDALHHWDG